MAVISLEKQLSIYKFCFYPTVTTWTWSHAASLTLLIADIMPKKRHPLSFFPHTVVGSFFLTVFTLPCLAFRETRA